jgi:hypothetical protein
MLKAEITQRRTAAFADLRRWFDVGPTDVRTTESDGELVVIARVPGANAQAMALRLLGAHFPGTPVRFEA